MKPFDLKLAKSGHPVCTKNGRDARIICFDRKFETYPIVALIDNRLGGEDIEYYTINGKYEFEAESEFDLFMTPVKREGWVNIYKEGFETWVDAEIFSTKENAIEYNEISTSVDRENYLTTVKIEWEE